MSKHYVFWRTPEGKPYSGIDGKYAPTEILAEYGRISNVTSEGKISHPILSFIERYKIALKLAVIVVGPDEEELNEQDTWAIVQSALIEILKKKGGKQPLAANEVLMAADSKAADFYRKDNISYILISDLSVESLPFKRIRVAGCQIEPLYSRCDFPYPKDIRIKVEPVIVKHIDSSEYKYVRVKTKGRSVNEAADRAFRALSILRGLWSLYATYGSWKIKFGGGRRDPIGVIHTGPIYTLHYLDKTLVKDCYWYERLASEDRKLYKSSLGWDKIEKLRRDAMKRIQILPCPFKKDIEDLIIRYIDALDQSDHDVAFLHMWSILEKITNTIGTNYDETIKRTIRLFKKLNLVKNLGDCVSFGPEI
jgi:hypothetical protein